jgi:hypothetical protein
LKRGKRFFIFIDREEDLEFYKPNMIKAKANTQKQGDYSRGITLPNAFALVEAHKVILFFILPPTMSTVE